MTTDSETHMRNSLEIVRNNESGDSGDDDDDDDECEKGTFLRRLPLSNIMKN